MDFCRTSVIVLVMSAAGAVTACGRGAPTTATAEASATGPSAPPSAEAPATTPTPPPSSGRKAGPPVIKAIFGIEYPLGEGRSEVILDAAGNIAMRGLAEVDCGGVDQSLDDVVVAQMEGKTVRDVDGRVLVELGDDGNVAVRAGAIAMGRTTSIDADGTLKADGREIAKDVRFEGEEERRRDAMLAYVAIDFFPRFGVYTMPPIPGVCSTTSPGQTAPSPAP